MYIIHSTDPQRYLHPAHCRQTPFSCLWRKALVRKECCKAAQKVLCDWDGGDHAKLRTECIKMLHCKSFGLKGLDLAEKSAELPAPWR